MKNKCFFPMFVDLSDKNIVVAGGGNIATRRVKTLLKFTRNIKVVAPKMTQELIELGKAGKIETLMRPIKRSDFSFAYMVLAATNDWKVNDEIYRVCKEEGIYVNVADNKEKCDFYFPGVYVEDEIVIGITASGQDHKKARKLRLAIEQTLEEMTGENKDGD
ncbi:MAG TPA: bifunctional precorrin-2 dehydrogenase/sirohydrochlorin ferrochelatase [Candidatus Blautia faecavium]|uniref:precorrin-2 dehydrogenase n=1 Tax=Candidatus Blautia faecavium TaxID=2838487 RepID=A0A9D2LVH9_9FIRM|nr:bifunctional precorrin-2 dehydrogenase/sirohydrochlorin ferrochelatase [Candidatus Blautia faecavium]